MDQETKKVFTPGPMAKFCRARKLSSNLKMAKLYPIERIVGWHKCKDKRCEVCLSVQETPYFTSPVTNEAYKVKHQFACNKKCLVYLLTCKKCLKQYVGQTMSTFWHRSNNYKNNNRQFKLSEPCIQEQLLRGFPSQVHNGFLIVFVPFIHKADLSDSQ